MIQDILFSIWFLLPAAAANASPIIAAHIPLIKRFNYPLDAGKTWHGREIFGSHKTWRGIIAGIIIATLVLYLQMQIAVHIPSSHIFDGPVQYASLPLFILGPLFAIGALGGDALESFFKRWRGIPSGQSWLPFDQLDYIIGSVLVSLPFVIAPPIDYVFMFLIWFLMHIIISYIGYKLSLKDEPI